MLLTSSENYKGDETFMKQLRKAIERRSRLKEQVRCLFELLPDVQFSTRLANDILLSPPLSAYLRTTGKTPGQSIGAYITSSGFYRQKIGKTTYYSLHPPRFQGTSRDQLPSRSNRSGRKKKARHPVAHTQKRRLPEAVPKLPADQSRFEEVAPDPAENDAPPDGSFPIPPNAHCIVNGTIMHFIFPFTSDPLNTTPSFVKQQVRTLQLRYHPDKVVGAQLISSNRSYEDFFHAFNSAVEAHKAASPSERYDSYVRAYTRICENNLDVNPAIFWYEEATQQRKEKPSDAN